MELSVQSAQRIVDEISGIVGQHINMMDERGNIIASTDGTRVGHFHAGAKRIVEEGLPELYVRPEDATPTVRAGLNLPITHGGRHRHHRRVRAGHRIRPGREKDDGDPYPRGQ